MDVRSTHTPKSDFLAIPEHHLRTKIYRLTSSVVTKRFALWRLPLFSSKTSMFFKCKQKNSLLSSSQTRPLFFPQYVPHVALLRDYLTPTSISLPNFFLICTIQLFWFYSFLQCRFQKPKSRLALLSIALLSISRSYCCLPYFTCVLHAEF